MSSIQVIVALLSLVNWLIDRAKRNKVIDEYEQQLLKKTVAKTNQLIEVKEQVSSEVGSMSDEAVYRYFEEQADRLAEEEARKAAIEEANREALQRG